jgi:hypothetical protein
MTPTEAIAMLDDQLADTRQSVTVRRYTDPGHVDRPKVELADIPAFVRAVSADDLVGDIKATSSKVTLSPTFWPLVDSDKIVIAGKERAVLLVKPLFMADQLVRCDLMVAG